MNKATMQTALVWFAALLGRLSGAHAVRSLLLSLQAMVG